MRMITSAFAATLTLMAGLPGWQVASALADSPPKLNVSPSCAAAARGAISIGRDKEACMSDERAAQELLAKNWSQYSGTHKAQCVGMTTQGGPSYVELISCLDIMRDADVIKKSDPYYGAAEKVERAPSRHHARRGSR
jgi:hypothetical protein